MNTLEPPRISRRIVPPFWLGALVVTELSLDRWLPGAHWIPSPWSYLGALVAAGGLALVGWAFVLFRRARTGIVPFSPASALVATGPYRMSRNPMYVGMTALLLGLAISLGSLTPFAAPVAFVAIITRLFILAEEAQLERTFGPAYLDLKARVRRWL